MRLLIFPHLCQHLLLPVFWLDPSGCEVVSPVVWICISLMANDVEHLFICLLASCISSLEKRLFRFFYYVIIRALYIFSIQVPYEIYDLQVFSCNLSIAFSFVWWYPLEHKSFSCWRSPICLFVLLLVLLVSYLRSQHLIRGREDLSLCFLLSVF